MRDKKVRAGGLRFVVMTKIGTAITQADVPPECVAASWREIGAA
jgi:3-dehydroquinate synthase